MKKLFAPTQEWIKGEVTELGADATAGSSVVLTVDNGAGFADHDFVVIGTLGGSTAEICQITAVSATSITVATLALNHKEDEPVTKYLYNQRQFYGCTTPDGSYTALTSYGSPANIIPNDPDGATLEYTGSEGYLYFKATYYNSYALTESDIAEANDTVIWDDSTRLCSIYDIRKQAGLTENPFLTDAYIETKRAEAENEVFSYIFERYILPLTNQTTNQQEIPSIIRNACTLLAGGYIDYIQFGSEGQGVKWLGEARGLLKAIRIGHQRLIGSDNNELLLKTKTNGPQSWPNKVYNENGPTRMFTTEQIF